MSQLWHLGVYMLNLEMNVIVWLFPILFMIHDFEEIIFIAQWREKSYFKTLPIKPFKGFINTASFSVAVAQEFILFSIVTIASILTNNYFMWFGFFSAITFHFAIHIGISIKNLRYHPGFATSIPFTILSIYLLFLAHNNLEFNSLELMVSFIVGFISLFLNLKLLHKLIPIFDEIIKSV